MPEGKFTRIDKDGPQRSAAPTCSTAKTVVLFPGPAHLNRPAMQAFAGFVALADEIKEERRGHHRVYRGEHVSS